MNVQAFDRYGVEVPYNLPTRYLYEFYTHPDFSKFKKAYINWTRRKSKWNKEKESLDFEIDANK